jgi:integrase
MSSKRRIQFDPRRGTYCVQISKGGIRKFFNLGTNRREARRNLDEIERDIANGRIQFAEQETTVTVRADGSVDIRLEELAVRHLEWMKTNRADQTFKLRQHYVSVFVSVLGPCMVSDITMAHIESFLKRVRNGRQEGGSHAIREVKSLLKWGEEYELCRNPVKRWPKVPQRQPTTRRFTDAEFAKLLSVVSDSFRSLLVFGTLTGLRPQELRQLKPENIVKTGSGCLTIYIEHHKTSESSKVPRPRTMPLSKQAEAIVRQEMAQHPNSAYIFLNGDGTPYTRTALRIRLMRWCKRAGIVPKPPYALRHIFGSTLAGNNINQSVIAQLMGHTNIHTTARYTVNADESHQKAIESMEASIAALLPDRTVSASESETSTLGMDDAGEPAPKVA